LNFTVKDDYRAGDILVFSKGARVTGEVAEASKRRLIGGSKMTLRLLTAETVHGQKVKVRALAAARAGEAARPVDTGARQKPQNVEATAGTSYIAYIDGQQTLAVHR
jgi:hypothetical protein